MSTKPCPDCGRTETSMDGTTEYCTRCGLVVPSATERAVTSDRYQPIQNEWRDIYFAMADLGLTDEQIRDARYGKGNW